MLFSGPCSDEQRREWMESLMEQKFQVEEEDTTLGMDYITQYPNWPARTSAGHDGIVI